MTSTGRWHDSRFGSTDNEKTPYVVNRQPRIEAALALLLLCIFSASCGQPNQRPVRPTVEIVENHLICEGSKNEPVLSLQGCSIYNSRDTIRPSDLFEGFSLYEKVILERCRFMGENPIAIPSTEQLYFDGCHAKNFENSISIDPRVDSLSLLSCHDLAGQLSVRPGPSSTTYVSLVNCNDCDRLPALLNKMSSLLHLTISRTDVNESFFDRLEISQVQHLNFAGTQTSHEMLDFCCRQVNLSTLVFDYSETIDVDSLNKVLSKETLDSCTIFHTSQLRPLDDLDVPSTVRVYLEEIEESAASRYGPVK